MKTIVAVSTPIGAGAISIVRMSGEDCLKIAGKVFFCKEKIEPRKMILGNFRYKELSERCLMVYFKAPHSYTGEDIVEFQCHGGVVLTKEILSALLENGAVMAENGEFSKRAFLNGKMSLDSAEGVIDMINASSEAELKAGFKLMSGELKNKATEMQDIITDALASIDMTLDYPEHNDEAETIRIIKEKLEEVKENLTRLVDTKRAGELIKSGVNIALVGRPNVGKSSLLNALIGSERAIVTDIPGTTRDTVTETIVYKDIKFNFTDTAGVRESDNVVEKIGIDRALDAAKEADIVLLVLDGSVPKTAEDEKLLDLTKDYRRIIILNKMDKEQKTFIDGAIKISAQNKKNIDDVKEAIYNHFASGKLDTSGLIITNARQMEALTNALNFTNQAIAACENETADIVSFTLKEVWQELGKITGETEKESIIDAIFSKFCLGK